MVIDLLTLGYFVRQPTALTHGFSRGTGVVEGTYTNPPHGFSCGQLNMALAVGKP